MIADLLIVCGVIVGFVVFVIGMTLLDLWLDRRRDL